MIDSSNGGRVSDMGAHATDLNLDPNERAAVETIEARLSQRAGFPITIRKLLSNWESFVAQIERGYDLSIDEYANDLSARDTLEDVLRSLPKGTHTKISGVLSSTDRRFERATCPDSTHAVERFIQPGTSWWWARIPVKLIEPLASALKIT